MTANSPDPCFDAKAQRKALAEVPMPRLQLRWAPNAKFDGRYQWSCHYELVLPLSEHDIRRETPGGRKVRDSLTIRMKPPTLRGGTGPEPMTLRGSTELYADTPYRDGAHSQWDAALLGGLPIYIIALDGRAVKLEKDGPAAVAPIRSPAT